MGIYIKGMEMPTEDEISKCIIIRHDGEVWIVEFDNLVDGGFVACYPTNPMRAVPVPPHGRLVDMGEIEELIDSCCDDIDCSKTMCNECAVQIVMNKVFDAPTIIPAEEGET